ncbi:MULTISPECIES: Gp138 family membrane-puncturing spike protein [unclassified Saccharibacter]|uniref:Gp138 family membrane-puncturing spike protein n=1 Tax=unclassified Saccharibacter TaxID=2648722 RepID=UPI001321DAD7|nr:MULTISPECIES: Gp138 family membrane-puncturing spike protein [unclassified Saccharibacter]MXV35730.1 baseplate assembly protein [Saccharibacter sp. EH611]MXV58343.1 baseplate assembly protein [Saccharibacter sp. EH70]MXV65814.1 baseplate assembly protein [Saccharibacter sp. EH60]
MPSPSNSPYLNQSVAGGNLKSAIDNLVHSHLTDIGPSILVRVESVDAGGASITGKVDVQPMVHQQDAVGRPFPRGLIHNVPYLRIQGGTSALIIDPQPGDIGFIIVAGRDMTHAITTRAPAPPASFRQHSLEDCIYVGGFLNNGPDQFIQATSDGWRIVTPGTVDIQASKITANCDIETSGDMKAGGISLKNHTHGGVQSGGSNTEPPS